MSKKRNNRNQKKVRKNLKKNHTGPVDDIEDAMKQMGKEAAQQFIQTIEPEVKCKRHGVHNRYMEVAMKGEDGENIEIYYCMDCLTQILDKAIGRMEVTKERRMVKKSLTSDEDVGLIDPMTLPSVEVPEESDEPVVDIDEIVEDEEDEKDD